MKISCSSFLLAGLVSVLIGCGKQEPPAKPDTSPSASSSSGNPITAPVDYLGAVAKAHKSATKTVSSVSLDQAIRTFYAQEGRYPKELKELVPEYVPTLPAAPQGMKYSYDPRTGTVKVLPQ